MNQAMKMNLLKRSNKMNSNTYGETLTVEIVSGGFILTYPRPDADGDAVICREVFTSPRKLNQKLKEVIDAVGLVTDK